MISFSYDQKKLYIPPHKRRIIEEQKRYDQEVILDRLPSQIYDFYWVYVNNPAHNYKYFDKTGKWLIFVPTSNIDEAWKIVKEATLANELGISAKSSTCKSNPVNTAGYNNHKDGVICVYTYNYDDFLDIKRVRNKLFELGFTKPLGYKTDHATKNGRYSFNSRGSVCKYRM